MEADKNTENRLKDINGSKKRFIFVSLSGKEDQSLIINIFFVGDLNFRQQKNAVYFKRNQQ